MDLQNNIDLKCSNLIGFLKDIHIDIHEILVPIVNKNVHDDTYILKSLIREKIIVPDSSNGYCTPKKITVQEKLNISNNVTVESRKELFLCHKFDCIPISHDLPVEVRPKIDISIPINREIDKNPILCEQIIDRIYENFDKDELRLNAKNAMLDQQFIDSSMYEISIDRLGAIHNGCKNQPETFYRAVSIINEYLTLKKDTKRSKFKLLVITAYFISSKYEEIYACEIVDIISFCDRAYDRKEIIDMELNILSVLGFNISRPTIYTFLLHYLKIAHADRQMVQIGFYLSERCLQDISFHRYNPSLIAASAVYIAREKTDFLTVWSDLLIYHSKYRENDLLECINKLKEIASRKDTYNNCYTKYSKDNFGSVSTLFD